MGTIGAIVYLFSFWRTNGIDPFPYIAPNQIIMHALGGITAITLSGLIGSALGAIIKKPRTTEELANPTFSWKNEWYIVVIFGLPFLFGVFIDPAVVYFGAVGLLGIFASFPLSKTDALLFISKSAEVRRLFIFAFFCIPGTAFLLGYANAMIKTHSDQKEIVHWVGDLRMQEIKGTIYLGRLGEHQIFIDPNSSERFIVNSSTVGPFSIIRSHGASKRFESTDPSGDGSEARP